MIGIITASMLSKRFPNKMTAELCGQPLIKYIINRAKHLNNLATLVVATTLNRRDNILVGMARRSGVEVDRGKPKDIAAQFIRCGRKYNGDYILRLNGDSPCFDISLIEGGIAKANGCDLVTNITEPRTYPYGISLEIIKTDTLERIYPDMSAYDREHVTSYFYGNRDKFHLKELCQVSDELMDFRFTIDFPEDIERLNEYLLRAPARV